MTKSPEEIVAGLQKVCRSNGEMESMVYELANTKSLTAWRPLGKVLFDTDRDRTIINGIPRNYLVIKNNKDKILRLISQLEIVHSMPVNESSMDIDKSKNEISSSNSKKELVKKMRVC